MRNANAPDRRRGLGPFTGGQLTIIIVSLIAAVALGTGVAVASIPGNGNIFYGCYATNGGALRLIDKALGQHCNTTTEKAVSWSQTGPQGPSGVTKMLQKDIACATNGGDEKFCGTPFTQTFDAKTAAHVTATQDIASNNGSHLSINLEICYAPHGSSTLTAVSSVDPDFTAPANSYFAESVSGVIKGLPAGSYDIGLCNAFGTSNVLYGLSSETAILAELP